MQPQQAYCWGACNIYLKERFDPCYFLFIAIGALPGAIIRWQLENNLLVNLLGAGVLGFVVGCKFRGNLRLMLSVGFCGALTTFSGWMLDSAELFLNGFFIQAFGLIIYTFSFGLFAGAIGFLLGRQIKRLRPFLLHLLSRGY